MKVAVIIDQYKPVRMVQLVSILLFSLLGTQPPQYSDSERILEATTLLFDNTFPVDSWKLRPTVRRMLFESPLPDAPIRVAFTIPTDELPRAHTMVAVFTNQGSTWEEIGTALLHVAVYDSVLSVVESIERGAVVNEAKVRPVLRDVTNRSSTYLSLTDWETLTNNSTELVASRDLIRDRLVRPSDVKKRPAVDIGAAVTMSVATNGLTITIECTAREEGTIDDEIRLYSKDTKRMYRARLDTPVRATWIETL